VSANILVVPAIREVTPDQLNEVCDIIREQGAEPAARPLREDLQALSERQLAVNDSLRRIVTQHVVRAVGPRIRSADGVLVVNPATEEVEAPSGERLCGIPYSVGFFATSVIKRANKAYGPENNQVFLTDSYPEGEELFRLQPPASMDPAVTRARQRVRGLYLLNPRPGALRRRWDSLPLIDSNE
jgi:hypothetical protein